jgi:hypothetical protein
MVVLAQKTVILPSEARVLILQRMAGIEDIDPHRLIFNNAESLFGFCILTLRSINYS